MKTRTSTAGKANKRQQGFTYLMVLAALIVVGILAEVATTLNSRLIQQEQEQDLLFRGLAYQNAIASYYHAGQARQYPRNLQVLVKDPRFLHKRHLRRLYPDPIGRKDWLLIRNARGGITGVASSSEKTPLKQANFDKQLVHFAGAKQYRDWIFEFKPAKTNKPKPR